jgi:nucleoside-diphosphate-sugar epimerase
LTAAGHEARPADTRVRGSVENALAGADAVVHLAARVHVRKDRAADPLAEFRRVNTDATLALGRAALRERVRRFVFLSSIKVNGERTEGRPFTERDAPAPVDAYAVSKWEAERGLAELGLDLVVLRPPLVYGPAVKGNFLRLMKLVARGVPLPLAGVANCRSLIYVGNLASAIERAACAERSVQGTFLVSDGEDLSAADLVRRLGDAMGRRARLFTLPTALLYALGRALGRREEVSRMIESLRVDCSAARRELQWEIPYTVEQGLKETTDWFVRARSAA